MLVFPEVLDKDQHELLHDMLVPIEKFFDEEGKIHFVLLSPCP